VDPVSLLRLVLIIAAVAAVLAPALHAQEHPNFTGTWRVQRVDASEPKRSDRDDRDFGRGGGGRGGRGGFGRRGGSGGFPGGSRDRGGRGGERRGDAMLREGDVLRISQTAERLIITRESPEGAVMTSYTLDGKETKNHPSPDVEVKSKTRWEGVALVTDGTQNVSTGRGDVSMKTREILTLSDDRDMLTAAMSADSPFGKRTVTAVLGRVQQ
jgi:hypothetical protein